MSSQLLPHDLTHFTLFSSDLEYPLEFARTEAGWFVLEYEYDAEGMIVLDSETERRVRGSLDSEIRDYVAAYYLAGVADVRGSTPEVVAKWFCDVLPDHVKNAGLSVDGQHFEVDDGGTLVAV